MIESYRILSYQEEQYNLILFMIALGRYRKTHTKGISQLEDNVFLCKKVSESPLI